MLRRKALVIATLSAAALISACGGSSTSEQVPAPTPDIVALAQATPDLSILVEAVVSAGLVNTLKAAGPYTVFAPTNAAFAALLTELGVTKDQLLANKPLLTAVLTYHVLPAKVASSAIPFGKAITTVQGSILKIDSVSGAVVITDGRNRTSKVVTADVAASNGVVHIVDKVILPADKNIVQTAQALPQFSILVEAVVAANLQGTLSGTGPFTVFAPTDAAFAKVDKATLAKLLLPENKAALVRVLTYHVVAGAVKAADVVKLTSAKTVEGNEVKITVTDGKVMVDNANVTATDVIASNGVIHIIDAVLLPPNLEIK